jgi:chloramphenicol O-acetyltransferase type A
MNRWPRAELYRLYTEGWGTVTYSLTKKLSVKKLVPYLKERGIKFAPTIIWLVSREVNRVENFRLAVRDGQLIRWDVIHPMFPTLNAQENMTFHGLRHRESFREFYDAYLAEQQENRDKTCLWANRIPPNFFMVSVIPWLHFDASSMQLRNAKEYFAPFIAIGQYNDAMELPCMLMGNHAATDAWHVAQFYSGLQAAMDDPAQWCL